MEAQHGDHEFTAWPQTYKSLVTVKITPTMATLLLLLHLFTSNAAPTCEILSIESIMELCKGVCSAASTVALDSRAEPQCGYHTNYRSTASIIWSCFSVIFACVWTATHPNVFGYQSTSGQRLKRRIALCSLALFLPEVNLIWSIKQWRGARAITQHMEAHREGEKS